MKRAKRRGFTIVELVIVIAVVAVLAAVLIPTFGNVINNAKDSAAMQEAKNAYTAYITDNPGITVEYAVYESDGRFVALRSGATVGVYESEEAALKSIIDASAEELVPIGKSGLWGYGVNSAYDTPSPTLEMKTYTFAEIYGTSNWQLGAYPFPSTDYRYFTNSAIIEAKAGTRIINPDSSKYYFAYQRFDAAGNEIGKMIHAPKGTAFDSVTIEEDTYIRICIKYIDGRTQTELSIVDVLNEFKVDTYEPDPTKKLKCSFLGDSITEGVNTTKTYHQYLADWCDIEAINVGWNGSHVSTYILSEDKHHVCMVERVQTVDLDSDVVFVFGGTNDFNRGCPMGTFESKDKNTFKGALAVMLQYLKDNFSDKKIYLMTPIRRSTFSEQLTDLQANKQGLYLTDYVNAIKEAGKLYDIEVIDLHSLTGLNPNEKECADKYFHNSGNIDNLHPNAKGHRVIAEAIKRYLDW